MGKHNGKIVSQSDLISNAPSDKLFEYDGVKCKLHVGNYPAAPLAMSLYLTDANTDERIGVMSVNLGNFQTDRPYSFVQMGTTYLDTNNNPNIFNALKEQGLATQCMCFGCLQYGHSGYCKYPLVEFDLERLSEYDSNGVNEYKKEWYKEMPKQQQKLNQRMMSVDIEGDFPDDEPGFLDFD